MERITTKKAIILSCAELMQKKTLDKISVSEICDNCGITRQLFYYYFKDKFDVVNLSYQQEANQIVQKTWGVLSWKNTLNEILLHMKENEPFYSNAFAYEGQNSFSRFLVDYTYDLYTNVMSWQGVRFPLPDHQLFSLEFYCHGAVSMARKWARTDMLAPTEYIAEQLASNIPRELTPFFR